MKGVGGEEGFGKWTGIIIPLSIRELCEMKKAYRSKMNWLGLALAGLGLLVDPTFQGSLAQIVPPEVMPKIISGSGLAIMILRTFFTSEAITPKKEE
jgi:hypothetical protein